MSIVVSLNLSVESIACEIYAASALRSVLGSSDRDKIVPLLTRNHRKALNSVIADAYAHTALKMLHHIKNFDDQNLENVEDDTILTLDVYVPDGFASNAGLSLCKAVEHAIAMQATHICYVGVDGELANRYETLSSEAIDAAIALIRKGGTLPRITPHWL